MITKNINNRDYTVDLKEINAREYLLAKGYNLINKTNMIERLMFKYTNIAKLLLLGGVSFIIWCMSIYGGVVTVSAYENDISVKDFERSMRVEACSVVYMNNKEFVDNTYIHTSQDVITRCATMMSLIGAFESSYYTSRRCTEDNACFGIKSWYTGKFKTYKSRFEGKLDFAEKYLVGRGDNSFKGHKNRNIKQFVYNWSHTDQVIYTKFVQDRYWDMYNELNKLDFIIR